MAAPPRDPRTLLPSPTLPLAYLATAHVAFALACAALALHPGLPGGFHYHPRLIALVHLVTLGWITSAILGSLYIVTPLAFGVPLRAGPLDWVAAVAYALGTGRIVWGFWTGYYSAVASGATLVLAAIAFVGGRVLPGLWRSRVPPGVSLHVTLAFVNVLAAGGAGLWMAVVRTSGTVALSPLALALAHGHAAVVGWAAMMIVGVSYRLIPMFLPAAMPAGAGLAVSALLLETGTLWLAWAFVSSGPTGIGTLLIVGGFASFFAQVRAMLASRRPRPVELPRPDWSTWQTHFALLSLFLTLAVGLALAFVGPSPALTWVYGTLGLVGFAAQMVVGIGGRLFPLHAWYRGMQRGSGLPVRSVHRLADPRLARAVLLLWLAGLPALTIGLALTMAPAVSVGASALLAATILNAWLLRSMVRSGIETAAGTGDGGADAPGPHRDEARGNKQGQDPSGI